MAIGDLTEVTHGDCSDLYYIDTGMFDAPGFGAVYILDAERPAVVDSGIGTNYERVLDAMAAVGVAPEDLELVALTHVHLDHAGGAGFLAEACPNATVAVHEIGAPHVADPSRLVAGTKAAVGDQWEFYTEPKPVPEARIREFADGDELDLGDRRLRVHHAPGHAPHQVVFENRAERTVFTADAAGIYVRERDAVFQTSPPANFDLEQCLADVRMVRDLNPEVLCYPHFGAAEAAGRLDEYETVLPEWVERVAEKRKGLADDEAVADHFAAAADLGDVWGERKTREEARLNVRGVLGYLDERESAE